MRTDVKSELDSLDCACAKPLPSNGLKIFSAPVGQTFRCACARKLSWLDKDILCACWTDLSLRMCKATELIGSRYSLRLWDKPFTAHAQGYWPDWVKIIFAPVRRTFHCACARQLTWLVKDIHSPCWTDLLLHNHMLEATDLMGSRKSLRLLDRPFTAHAQGNKPDWIKIFSHQLDRPFTAHAQEIWPDWIKIFSRQLDRPFTAHAQENWPDWIKIFSAPDGQNFHCTSARQLTWLDQDILCVCWTDTEHAQGNWPDWIKIFSAPVGQSFPTGDRTIWPFRPTGQLTSSGKKKTFT